MSRVSGSRSLKLICPQRRMVRYQGTGAWGAPNNEPVTAAPERRSSSRRVAGMRDTVLPFARLGQAHPHKTCYTDSVETRSATQNLTLAIESDLLLEARKLALERRTTVNQLVRDYLAALVKEQERKQAARARLKAAMEEGLVEVGPITWKR